MALDAGIDKYTTGRFLRTETDGPDTFAFRKKGCFVPVAGDAYTLVYLRISVLLESLALAPTAVILGDFEDKALKYTETGGKYTLAFATSAVLHIGCIQKALYFRWPIADFGNAHPFTAGGSVQLHRRSTMACF